MHHEGARLPFNDNRRDLQFKLRNWVAIKRKQKLLELQRLEEAYQFDFSVPLALAEKELLIYFYASLDLLR